MIPNGIHQEIMIRNRMHPQIQQIFPNQGGLLNMMSLLQNQAAVLNLLMNKME
jgi:hypothetical protein